jgi:hypothetical protein
MGSDSSKSSDPDQESIKKEVNKFYYFSRHNKNLYEVTSERVNKLKVKGKIKIYHDSAISTLENDKIVVVGGSNLLNNPTCNAFYINCSDHKIHQFESPPRRTKEGQIFVQDGTLYFVGTTIESNEHSAAIQGGPVMLYNRNRREWTEISYNEIKKDNFFSLVGHQKTFDDLNLEEINFNLNSIIASGVFLLDNRIYFVGGKVFDGSQYYPSKKVFSLGIAHWDLRVEPFSLPVGLVNPMCVTKGSNAFITGGTLEDGKANLDIFIYKSKSTSILKYGVSFESRPEEHYSPVIVREDIVFPSYPKFWIKPKGQKELNSYTIDKVRFEDYGKIRRTFQHSSVPIPAQFIKVKNHTLTFMDFVVTNGDYISDHSNNMIPFIKKQAIDLASTAFHVGENLNVVAKPKVLTDVTSVQQVKFVLNGKTAVFTVNSNLLHCDYMSIDFEKVINENVDEAPSNWVHPVIVNKVHYTNWDRTITAEKIWTAAPKNFEELCLICDWGADNGYLIRPRGVVHGWSPLTIVNNEKGKVLLVDLTKYPAPMQFNPTGPYGPTVTVSAGTTQGELMTFLEQQEGNGDAPGWSFPHIPAPAHLTIGGMLAINGHGTAIPVNSEHFNVSYGSLSNHVVELWAVVTENGSHKYTVKKFDRKDKDIKALLAHLGRTIVVQVTMKVIPNYNLRCQSIVDLSFDTLFAAPVDGANPVHSIGDLAERSGRVEIIMFPFTEFPWTKVWTHEPVLPIDSVKVEGMNNYPFSDSYPDYITDLLRKVLTCPSLTPKLCQIMSDYSNSKLVEENLTDLWGPSKNTLIYVRDQTLRVTANGYAIHMNRSYIQQASHYFGMKFNKMVQKYARNKKWPMNSPLEIRITALDKNEHIFEDCKDEYNRPVISALAYNKLDKEKGWDVALWVDLLCLPGTQHSYEFYEELEAWLYKTFNGEHARVYVEWSKGWAYTAKNGPWHSEPVIQDIRNAFTEHRDEDDTWDWEKRTLEKYDSRNLFYSNFNRHLFS